jgi:hypothetical protein
MALVPLADCPVFAPDNDACTHCTHCNQLYEDHPPHKQTPHRFTIDRCIEFLRAANTKVVPGDEIDPVLLPELVAYQHQAADHLERLAAFRQSCADIVAGKSSAEEVVNETLFRYVANDLGYSISAEPGLSETQLKDQINAELRSVVDRYAPDYTAPPLTTLLVVTARAMGLTKKAVTDQIDLLWQLSDRFDRKKTDG